jgi:xylose isomerase
MEKLPWKISGGLWFIESKGGDRFTSQFKEGIPVEERIKLLGDSKLVNGIELHYPYEVEEDSFDRIRNVAKDFNLKILAVCPGLFKEMEFKNGALTSSNKNTRNNAIKRIVTAMKMNEVLKNNGEGGDFAIYWPSADGTTYPFDSDHIKKRKMIKDGLLECLKTTKGTIVHEYKPSDPAAKSCFGFTGEAILLARDLRKEIGDDSRVGINPEMAHLLMADSLLGYDISYLIEEKMLFHTHWNTCRRRGADTDMIVGTDNFYDTMEVFFWLKRHNYDKWLGLDLMPKNENSIEAVRVSIQAMTFMYNKLLEIYDKVTEFIDSGREDVTEIYKYIFK